MTPAPMPILDELAREGLSGHIRLDRGGETLVNRAFGFADRTSDTTNTTATRFAVASITKMFTAVRVLQLHRDGALDIHATLDAEFFEIAPALRSGATAHDLMTHRSGLGDYLTDGGGLPFADMPVAELVTPSSFIPLLRQVSVDPQSWPNGAYSSAGYIVLGLLIERVTDGDYFGQIEEHVFAAANMSDCGFFFVDQPPDRCAIGYLKDGRANTPHLPRRGGPDGGAYCTAPDLIRFLHAVRDETLLTLQLQRVLLEPPTDLSRDENPGCGQLHLVRHGYRWTGHAGSDPGVSAMAFRDDRRDYDLVCLCNQSPDAFRAFRRLVEAI